MTLATLRDVLTPACAQGYAVLGVVVLGWEDACAYVAAAEAEGAPIILQAGPGCRAHTPLPVLAAMLRTLAEAAPGPVVVHLDHGYALDECLAAIDHGFTSVMFDGSNLPLVENIAKTARLVARAHAAGVSVEAEVGSVGYAKGVASRPTDPAEAAALVRETGVDALAVSVGNLHLQQGPEARIDLGALRAVEAVTDVPLVLHGASGIPHAMRVRLARETRVSKFNVGTERRMAFGRALRDVLARDAAVFDRIAILRETVAPMRETLRPLIRAVGPDIQVADR